MYLKKDFYSTRECKNKGMKNIFHFPFQLVHIPICLSLSARLFITIGSFLRKSES